MNHAIHAVHFAFRMATPIFQVDSMHGGDAVRGSIVNSCMARVTGGNQDSIACTCPGGVHGTYPGFLQSDPSTWDAELYHQVNICTAAYLDWELEEFMHKHCRWVGTYIPEG